MNAYETCHELMLLQTKHVPIEGASVSYILVQIAETDKTIGVHSQFINPSVPDRHTPVNFTALSLDMQLGLISLPRITETIRHAHRELNEIMEMSLDKENHAECTKKLGKLLKTAVMVKN